MNICVINGSPRGKYSTTVQTLLYLEKRYPCHHFEYINAGTRINALEKDMKEALKAMIKSGLIVFSYPVYTFIAPSQLHRFIYAMKNSGEDFSGKYVTQITTSKHFYDVTAHRYIEDNCHDMKMNVIHGLSLDMEDMLSDKGQKNAESFFEYAVHCTEKGIYEEKPEAEISTQTKYTPSLEKNEKSDKFDVVIVCDLDDKDTSLLAMTEDFVSVFPYKTRIVNIAKYPFAGSCIGCFSCAGSGKCIYKDGFDTFLRESVQSADAIIYAFTVRDHSMGARFKTYDDRQFCNGHRTVTEGMPIGYIACGDIMREQNLREIIEARAEVGHNFLSGIGYNAKTLSDMSERLSYALENKYVQPRNFYGVGGMKIFRDLIWMMRGLMKADHDFYKKHGIYDFPQKQRGKMLRMCLLGALVRNPKIKAKMGSRMNEGMVAPYKKIIEKATPKK